MEGEQGSDGQILRPAAAIAAIATVFWWSAERYSSRPFSWARDLQDTRPHQAHGARQLATRQESCSSRRPRIRKLGGRAVLTDIYARVLSVVVWWCVVATARFWGTGRARARRMAFARAGLTGPTARPIN